MSTSPYEIIAGPASMWLAVLDTPFPGVNVADPAVFNAAWKPLGRTDGGVKAKHSQTVNLIRADQSTGPVKAQRTEEMLEISTNLMNLTLENFALVLNNATVSTDTSPNRKTIGMYQGLDVAEFALLVRGPSPYGDFYLQYEVPIVVQTDDPEEAFTRDDKAVLAIKWDALEDPDATSEDERFGRMIAQTS